MIYNTFWFLCNKCKNLFHLFIIIFLFINSEFRFNMFGSFAFFMVFIPWFILGTILSRFVYFFFSTRGVFTNSRFLGTNLERRHPDKITLTWFMPMRILFDYVIIGSTFDLSKFAAWLRILQPNLTNFGREEYIDNYGLVSSIWILTWTLAIFAIVGVLIKNLFIWALQRASCREDKEQRKLEEYVELHLKSMPRRNWKICCRVFVTCEAYLMRLVALKYIWNT